MEKTIVLGTAITDVSLDQAESICLDFLKSPKIQYVVTPNPEMLVFGYRNKWYRRIFEHADLSIPDGAGLKLGAFFLRKKIRNRTTGVDLTKRLLAKAEELSHSVLFLGGSEGIEVPLLENLKKEFPRLQVSHINGGRVEKDGRLQSESVVSDINVLSPDMIFVCFGHPKQEQFIKRYKDQLNTRVLFGVGGTIDFLAGTRIRAPRWMNRLWIEWLYRLIQEPSRIKRIWNAIIKFPLLCLWWRYRSTFVYRSNVAGLIVDKGDILTGRHALTGYWQIPQGGMKAQETIDEAIDREIPDEIGSKKYEIKGILEHCYSYEWEQNYRDIHGYRGQRQSLVLLHFSGNRDEIEMSPHEFTAHEWISRHQILADKRIPDFKKAIIKKGIDHFDI